MMILKMVNVHIIRVISIIYIIYLMSIIAIIAIITNGCVVGWLESVGSRVVYELDYKKPVL